MGIQRSWLDHRSPSHLTYTGINKVCCLPGAPPAASSLAFSLEKAGRALYASACTCTASRDGGGGEHHGDGRSTKIGPWRLVLPCLHLFVLLRKQGMWYATPPPQPRYRIITARSRYGTIKFSSREAGEETTP
jgi:hypothetical protein